MKVFAIPTIASGLTAAMSVLFFIGLSRVVGDQLLGQVILVQAAAAIVAMVCIPQCWVYLLAAADRKDLLARYRRGFTAEAAGFAAGVVVIAATLAFSTDGRWSGGLLIFVSLAVQASSSCLGWLRATESWYRYILWVVGPNLIRVPLIWATPWLVSHEWLPDARNHQANVIILYFLAPDLVRWLAIAVPIALRNYRWPGLSETVAATRIILQNWLFDVGSALTETADKVVVGTLLGPQTLVAYFFARRLGIVATMVCEPFYAEQFRRTLAVSDSLARSVRQTRVYRLGLGLAIALFAVMMAAVLFATNVPMLARWVPEAILVLLPVFTLVLLLDCLSAANRWSRFVVQINGGHAMLLGARIALFCLFTFNVWIVGDRLGGLGLAAAFALSWLLETGYISNLLHGANQRALSKSTRNTPQRSS